MAEEEIKRIFLDAGHGGKDPGAVGFVREADKAKKVTLYQAAHLMENYVCEVYCDTTADSIRTVVARANNWGAHVFNSNHFNAGKGNGYEGLVYGPATRELAMIMWKHVEKTGQNYHGEIEGLSVSNVVKYRPDLGVLRLTNMDAILNEIAYVDNWEDIKDWDQDAELKIMGAALADGLAEYLDLPKKEKNTTKPTRLEEIKLKALFKVKVDEGLNLRTGPGTEYEKIGYCDKGTTQTIYDTNKEKTWGYNGEGWHSIKSAYTTKL